MSKFRIDITKLLLSAVVLLFLPALTVGADTTGNIIDSSNSTDSLIVIDSTATAAKTEPDAPVTKTTVPESSGIAFRTDRLNALVFMILFSVVILIYTRWARAGKKLFIRKINGLDEVEEAVGRATEMGKPVLFIPGLQEIDEIETIAGISILGRVARITARYDTPLMVPVRYPMVLAAGQEVVEQAYIEEGKPDAYNKDIVRYVAGEQFAFTATVNGIMMRDRPATNIYMGAFFAESLLLSETGNAAGSIQIAGTAQPAQLPFFIAACDYTLMGEELYAASAYLSHEPLLLGGLKGQDWMKVLLISLIILGVLMVSFDVGDWYLSLFESV
ncbi:MAG: hypothetical protein GY841_09995 [FCB group bacterium]|nr:hypothetical protein [FCB group bacterium]